MSPLRTPLEVYRLLPKTNCRKCSVSSCMAFAAAVIKAEKSLADCPFLDPAVVAEYGGAVQPQVNLDRIREEALRELKAQVAGVDLAARARLLGGRMSGDRLVLSCLGRDFAIDQRGVIQSHCHTHAWFALPFLAYVLQSEGKAPAGSWVHFRDLEHGRTWARLFAQRCEHPLRELADASGELFPDLITLFSGSSSKGLYASDVSVVLQPFPRVPVMVCYWRPEEGMESKLHLFFDVTAEQNLPIDSLFSLSTGIVTMLEKIVRTHEAAGQGSAKR